MRGSGLDLLVVQFLLDLDVDDSDVDESDFAGDVETVVDSSPLTVSFLLLLLL